VWNISRGGYTTGTLQGGKLVYGDRTYTFVDTSAEPCPSDLRNQIYVRTLQADRNSTGTSFLGFNVNMEVRVYVALCDQITAPPSWLQTQGWQKTGAKLFTTDPTPGRDLYLKQFPAGRVTLGGNWQAGMPPGRSMYTVVVLAYTTASENWLIYSDAGADKRPALAEFRRR